MMPVTCRENERRKGGGDEHDYPAEHDFLPGATPEEIMEALSVAVLMGGGPSVIYATHVAEALEQFEAP